jgi:Xaa-Pro aminopeptidase
MLTSDEPGIYVAGKYGIRTENLILCKEAEQNDFGRFLCFETLTLAPIDLDAVDSSLLSPQEKQWLNEYHARVYHSIAPHLTEDERNWLFEATLPV